MHPLLAINLGPMEIILLLILGVLIFGRRLPEVGRSLGKGIMEFKKGMRGLEDELDLNHQAPPPGPTYRSEQPAIEPLRPPQRVTPTAPKFEDAPVIQPPPRPEATSAEQRTTQWPTPQTPSPAQNNASTAPKFDPQPPPA